MLASDKIKQIIEFVKDKPIEVIYLFGSQAKGEVKPLSDYDFAVLFDTALLSSERFDLKLELIVFLTHLFSTDKVDVVDLNSAPVAFQYEAIKPRMDIYTRSRIKRDEFEFKTMQEFFDRIYYIKRQTAQVLNRIARNGFD